jgi:outer membrane protein
MPLYAGGRVAAAIDQARGGQAMAALALADARSRVMVGAVAAHAELLAARRIEARYQQLASELAEVERQAKLRFQSGEIPASTLPPPPPAALRVRPALPPHRGAASPPRRNMPA